MSLTLQQPASPQFDPSAIHDGYLDDPGTTIRRVIGGAGTFDSASNPRFPDFTESDPPDSYQPQASATPTYAVLPRSYRAPRKIQVPGFGTRKM